MKHEMTVREDGLTLVTIEMPESETVSAQMTFNAGTRFEDPERWGLSHFFEHMLFKQTKKFKNSKEVSAELDEVGAIQNAFTSNEVVSVWVKTAKGNVEKAFEVNSELVINPLFPEKEVEEEKKVVIEEIRMVQDKPDWVISVEWEKWMMGNQRAVLDVLGVEKTVKKIGREDLVKHFEKTFVPKNGVSVVVGGVSHEEHLRLAEKWLKFENEGEGLSDEQFEIEKIVPEKVLLISKKELNQANLELGTSLEGMKSEDVAALRILNTVLDGGMSARLFQEVREKHHLCYSVHAGGIHFSDFGLWSISGGMNVPQVEKAVGVMLGEIRKLREEKVEAEELKKAKSNMKGKLAIAFESTSGVADRASLDWLGMGKVRTMEEIVRENEGVTSEDVMRVAQKYFAPERLRLGVIGPFGEEVKGRLEEVMG